MSVRNILLQPSVWFVAATLLVLYGAIAVWNQYHDQLVHYDKFELDESSIRVHQPEPEWADQNISDRVLCQLADATLLQPGLVKQTAEIIRSIGWVEQVHRVEKSSAGLDIDVAYRHPVAMVKMDGKHLLPVDRHGVILDGALFSPESVENFLRISIYRPVPAATELITWQPWPDQRVRAAASIGYALQHHWKSQELYRIVSFQMPGNRATPEPFELWTEGHIRADDPNKTPYAAKILWGNAPGFESPGEPTPHAKIEAIESFIQRRGPLAKSIPRGRVLDVRTGKPILVSKLRTARQKKIGETLAR